MLTNEPIRPEALELLRRLDDAGAFVEALKEGSLAGLTAGGRLLEREERELLASVTWAELLAHSEQLRARVDMHAQLEALMRELHTLLEPELSAVPGRSPEDAFDLVDPDRQAKAAELRQRIDTLMLLVDPGARTGRELAEAYLAGRVLVAWTEDGRPGAFVDVEPDPDRPPPLLFQPAEALVFLVGEEAEELMTAAPEAWRVAWLAEAVGDVVEDVLAQEMAAGRVIGHSDGTFSPVHDAEDPEAEVDGGDQR